MFQNYLTIALRNFRRHKAFTIINVAGLALGITCAILIFLMVDLHSGFDSYHRQANNTYRLVTDLHFEQTINTPGVPYPFPKAVKEELPQVDKLSAFYDEGGILVTVEENGKKKKYQFDELQGAYVEPAFFEIFDYQWLAGDASVLAEPNKAVITQNLAKQFFGENNPIGKQVKINNDQDFVVAGVVGDLPENTDLRAQVLCSYVTFSEKQKEQMSSWDGVSSDHRCFVTLVEGATPGQLETALVAFNDKFHPENKGKGPSGGNSWQSKVQPLNDVHFNPAYDNVVDKSIIWALSLVGLLLIGTACINFVNIATAQALTRSREVGIRKVVGGNRWQLFWQFMMETGAIVLVAIVVASALVTPVLPYLSEIIQSKLEFNLLENSQLWLLLLAIFVGVTFFSGIYPALVLAGFQPALAVKGRITTQSLGGFNIRRALVVLQFAISQLLIIAAVVMTSQLNFMKKSDMGFNPDAVVILNLPDNDGEKLRTLKNRMLGIPGVEDLSFSSTTPASGSHNNSNLRYDSRQEDEKWYATIRPADAEFLEMYGIELVAGRNIQPSDTVREYLVNELVTEKLGLAMPEEAVGKNLTVWGRTAPIAGVVKNYITSSMAQGVSPVVMMSDASRFRNANVKISTAEVPGTLATIEKTWNELYPDHFYDYQFLDERIARFYELESILLTLIRFFCGIAIIIGCLGLYGLVTFLVARRLKEIGVRKVLGASVPGILGLFGKEFVRLILIAFVIAAPLGYLAMNGFLQTYAYAVEIGAWMFLLAILLTALIAAATVGWHSWQAARCNPAEVLKSE